MKQVKEQKLGSETYLQKVKVQHVEKKINIRHTSWNYIWDLQSNVPKISKLLLELPKGMLVQR